MSAPVARQMQPHPASGGRGAEVEQGWPARLHGWLPLQPIAAMHGPERRASAWEKRR